MTPTTTRRRAATVLVVVVLAIAGAYAIMPAGAAPQALSLTISSGQLTVGDQTFNLPAGGGLSGQLDDETGALTGTFSFPVITADITDPLPVQVKVTLSQTGGGTGTVDLDTGATTFDVTIRIGLEIRTAQGALIVGDPCGIGPVNLAFEGTYDTTTGGMTLSDTGFALPNSSGCSAPGLDFGPIIDDLLGGNTAASLVLTSGAPPTTTQTTQDGSSTTRTPSTVSTPTGPTRTPGTPPSGGPTRPVDRNPSGPTNVRTDVVQPRIIDRTTTVEVVRAPARLTG